MCPEKGNVSGFNYNLKGNVSGIGKINVSEMCPEFSDFGFFSLRMGCSEMDYRHNQCSRWFYWTAVSFADIYMVSLTYLCCLPGPSTALLRSHLGFWTG